MEKLPLLGARFGKRVLSKAAVTCLANGRETGYVRGIVSLPNVIGTRLTLGTFRIRSHLNLSTERLCRFRSISSDVPKPSYNDRAGDRGGKVIGIM